ncbi:hypothetical protein CDD82_33 [Ophiocordyceps australis]|uniref:Ketoreductase domain-containing protein n=1 Tax=Ophiocordyceps australis TaxID=1399860 RepID=A0A2C5ZVD8_9HYPO|nr:hypothetical protein CDD82_33 [Ophiocordyceps australis]
MSLFAGKHCAVVGATGAIGLPIAAAFARHGAALSLLGRSAVESRRRLESHLPPPPPRAPHRFLRLDVSDPVDVKRVFAGPSPDSTDESTDPSSHSSKATCPAPVGPIDFLVNCAGISHTSLLKRTSEAHLANVVNTNLLAAMFVCKHANVRPHGCIINVSSLMAIKGGLGTTAYAASKAGLVAFTRAFCREMAARSIRVNALLPGWVESPMWHHLKPELQQAFLEDTPLRRVASPQEVADAAIFLASNGFANNCVLNLDGGLSAS